MLFYNAVVLKVAILEKIGPARATCKHAQNEVLFFLWH